MASLKTTPAQRRSLSYDHTTQWLPARQQSWQDYYSGLDQQKDSRQAAADQRNQERQSQWSDYHAHEAERAATRDNWPTALDFAKENRRTSQQMAAQNAERQGIHQAREDEQYEFQRQAQMEQLAHPPRLQQQREASQNTQQQRQQMLDEASHPPRLQQARQQREAAKMLTLRDYWAQNAVKAAAELAHLEGLEPPPA